MAQLARCRHEKTVFVILLMTAIYLLPLSGANLLSADDHRIPIV